MLRCECLSTDHYDDLRTSVLGDIAYLPGTPADRRATFQLFCDLGLSTVDATGAPVALHFVQMPTAETQNVSADLHLEALANLHSLGLLIGSPAAGYRPNPYLPWYGMFWRLAHTARLDAQPFRSAASSNFAEPVSNSPHI